MRPSPAAGSLSVRAVGPFQCRQGVDQSSLLAGMVPVEGLDKVWVKKSAKLSGVAIHFLSWLSSVWPLDVPIVVTRSAVDSRAQAAAMLDMARSRGRDHLYTLYSKSNKDIIDRLFQQSPSVEAWASVLREFENKGRPISSHMREDGGAVDVRCWNMTSADRLRVAQLIADEQPGLEVVLEPDHIHIESLGDLVDERESGALVADAGAGASSDFAFGRFNESQSGSRLLYRDSSLPVPPAHASRCSGRSLRSSLTQSAGDIFPAAAILLGGFVLARMSEKP